ncbi:hypothetical protein DPMN_180086 [Dreissena polymorpha]|uniref:Uncharacterized protein n=1 Tax=Dreissena polymorpha TaxID=45954 RepID=A0A9D4EE24_DREPO|nr:hypothetical protein DPMN_180086 [Dreissena polymorpha]
MCKHGSVKAMERKHRGWGEKLLVKGENTKNTTYLKNFLTNEENKQQLVKIMCKSIQQ